MTGGHHNVDGGRAPENIGALDGDVLAAAQAAAQAQHRPFKHVVNDLLRVGLAQTGKPAARRKFKVRPLPIGPMRPDLNENWRPDEILDRVEGPNRS